MLYQALALLANAEAWHTLLLRRWDKHNIANAHLGCAIPSPVIAFRNYAFPPLLFSTQSVICPCLFAWLSTPRPRTGQLRPPMICQSLAVDFYAIAWLRSAMPCLCCVALRNAVARLSCAFALLRDALPLLRVALLCLCLSNASHFVAPARKCPAPPMLFILLPNFAFAVERSTKPHPAVAIQIGPPLWPPAYRPLFLRDSLP